MDESWHIYRVFPGQEAKAAFRFLRFPTFLPEFTQYTFNRRQRIGRWTSHVFFPGYLFVQAKDAANSLAPHVPCSTIFGLLRKVNRHPALLSSSEMVKLQTFCKEYVHPSLLPKDKEQPVLIPSGQAVQIKEGTFAGFPAVVVKALTPGLLELDIEIFGRTNRVQTEVTNVKVAA